MIGMFATFLGLDHGTVLLVTTLVATLATFLSVLAIMVFAWGPYVSRKYAEEFGVGRIEEPSSEEYASD